MTNSPYIFEVTRENFTSLVLAKSAEVPILVDFWAGWCAPCQMLMPVLAKLAEEYQGDFLLAKINSDEQGDLAAQHGVRSLPTLKIFRHGEVVEEIIGAQPEPVIRQVIDRYIVRESDRMVDRAWEIYRQGSVDQAIEQLQSAARSDPNNSRPNLELAKMLLEIGEVDGADVVLNDLPRELQNSTEAATLRGRIRFARLAQEAPDETSLLAAIEADPKNSEARYQLSGIYVQRGLYEAALEQLLEIVRRDRSYGDDAGRKAMLELFELLEGEDELINRYRKRMFTTLH